MTIYFTSDLHFGHHNVIEYSNRPFKNVEEMNKHMITQWNRRVRVDDTVIVVGDFYLGGQKKEIAGILSQLNGTKILVRGNHDYKNAEMMTSGFDFSCDEIDMYIAGEKVKISHYPYRQSKFDLYWHKFLMKIGFRKHWFDKHYLKKPVNRGGFLIHGHTHSKNKINGRMIHVGVDANEFNPVPLERVANWIMDVKKKEFNK